MSITILPAVPDLVPEEYARVRNKALKLGATDFGLSDTKTKRFYVIYNNRKINFGSKVGHTYIDHKNELLRKNWRKRHSKIIRSSDGTPFYLIKESPSFWSYNLLW